MITPFTDEEDILWEQGLPGKMMSACLAIRYQETVLMVKASYKDHWSFPGGIIDEHESPLSAAVREAQEETGLSFTTEACSPLSVVYTSAKNGHRDRLNFAFTAEVLTDTLSLAIPNEEIDEAKWVPISEVAAMANHRLSYQKLQKALLDRSVATFYVENN